MLSHARGGCIPLDGRIFGTRTRRAQPPLQRVGGRSLSPERLRLASRRTHLRSRFSWRLPRELARLRLAPPCLESEPTWLSSDPITKGTARSPLDDGTCQLMLIDTSFASGRTRPERTLTHSPTLRHTTNSWRARSCQVVGSLICMTPSWRVPDHGSELGEFSLCSDSVIPTFTRWDSLRRITELFTEEENEAFRTSG